ncbi:MAG: cysteine desulfurase NifS [Ruminococcaceae bacterium]|nr:cysteine desulfurase NifS [Oscillospiraceae bacterium]
MKRFVYADNAATTPVSREVVDAMMPYLTEKWGNPSSLHAKGREAAVALEDARGRIAACLGADAKEIFFTSCGSESDNWAIKGAAYAGRQKGKTHIITSKIEHHAALHACAALEKEGFTVTYLGVDEKGVVSVEELKAAITDKTALVSVMLANNEIGTIEPIAEIAKIAHEHGALMFTDAVQAIGNIPVNVKELGVDMLALSGHKIHAPKGIGALYVRKGVRISNLIDGGGQERSKRGGTENMPYIIGLATAMENAIARLPEMVKVAEIRDYLIDEILSKVPYSTLNGPRGDARLPGNVNIGFEFIEGESMLLLLDFEGIACSTGSACSSASLDPSHVLLSIGVPHERAHGSLRLSISNETTKEDADYILEKLPPIIQRLRDMSPLYEEVAKKAKK